MPNNNNRINFQVGYNVDQASVNAVKKSLQDLQNIKFKDFNGPKKDLDDIKQKASQVEAALNKAFNVNLNSLNTQAFNAELQKAGLNIDKIYTSFSKAGAQGQVAFSRMASEVLTTNMQLKQTNSLVSQMGETMANTVKWGIASSVMNNFTNSVRQAFDYVKALDSSLNDIRIVTKQSSEEMANFAVQANNSAQALGRSTMDYTKAALTFYQQGLDEASVQARTESVLKAQNITGAGEEMADYLTAVWNGYKVANEEAELYVDKLAAVADSSASNMSQLAIAMSKVASSANLLGVPVDNLNAQIATIVATTRQAPESVGNALKTIYSRINDIATGADDAEISLGNYSAKMAQVGINVLDANGRLRDTGDVIDEIGGKWETLSHEQQIYLARTMAGQRQYNNLLALFENWGKYSDLVNVSMEAQGATAQKNAIYLESLGAKLEQLGAAGEKVKSALIDEDDLKGLVDFGTGAVNLFGNLIQSIGGGKGALLTFGSIFTQVFSGTIAKELNNIITNFQNFKNNDLLKIKDIENTELYGISKGYKDISGMVQAKKAAQDYYDFMDAAQINQYNNIVKKIGQSQNEVTLLQEKVDIAKQYSQILQDTADKSGQEFVDQLDLAVEKAQTLADTLDNIKGSGLNQVTDYDTFAQITNQVIELKQNVGQGFLKEEFTEFEALSQKLAEKFAQGEGAIRGAKTEFLRFIQLARLFNSQAGQGNNFTLQQQQNEEALKKVNAQLEMAKRASQEYLQAIKQFSTIKTFVNMVAGIGQVASGINNLVNITKIWKNENLSAGEKILQTFTNLGMTIPMLINGFTKVAEGFNKIVDIGKLSIISKREETKAALEAALAEEAQAVANTTGAGAALAHAKAQISLSAALKQVAIDAWAAIAPFAPYIAAIAAVGVAIYGLYKWYNKAADAAQKAAQSTKKAKEAYQKANNSYKNLKSSLDDLASANDHFNELTKGTQEWRDALQEVNEKVLAIIQEFPELKGQIVTSQEGLLSLTQTGQQTVQELYQRRAMANAYAYAKSDQANTQAQNYSLITDLSREIDGLRGLTPDQLQSVVAAINQHGQYILQNSDWLEQNTSLSQDDIEAVLNNTDKIIQLSNQINANTIASQNLTDSILKGQIVNTDYYKNSSNPEAYARLVVAAIDKAAQFNDENYRIANSNNINNPEIIKRYQELFPQGQYAKGLIPWEEKNGQWIYKFENAEGEMQKVNASLIKEAIAHYEATSQASSIYADTYNLVQSLGKQQAEILSLFSNGINGIELDWSKLSIKDINQILNNQDLIDIIANMLGQGIEAEDIKNRLVQSKEDIKNATASYLNSLPSSVAEATRNFIKSDSSLSITQQMKQAIGKLLSNSYAKGLEQFKNTENILKGLDIQEILPFQQILNSFTGTDFSLDEFKTALGQAGITLDNVSDDALQNFINQIKAIEEAINPQETYKSLHEIIDGLEVGDTISAEQTEALKAAGLDIDSYFIHMADGSLRLKTDAKEFYDYVNNQTLQGFKNKIQSLGEEYTSIAQANVLKHSAARAERRGQDLDSVFQEFSSSSYRGGQSGHLAYDSNLLQQQLTFLRAIGVEDERITAVQEVLSGERQLQKEDLKNLAELVAENKQQWEQTPEKVRQVQQEIKNTRQQLAYAGLQQLTSLAELRKALYENDDGIGVTSQQQYAREQAILETYSAMRDTYLEDQVKRLGITRQQYNDTYDELQNHLKQTSQSFNELSEAQQQIELDQLTSRVYDLGDALDQLKGISSDSLDSIQQLINSDAITTPDFYEQIGQLQAALKGIFQTDIDLSFIAQNFDLIRQLAQGDITALDELSIALAQDFTAQIRAEADTQSAIDAANEFDAFLSTVDLQDLPVGISLDDAEFTSALQEFVTKAGLTAEEVNRLLGEIGFEPQVTEQNIPFDEINQGQHGYQYSYTYTDPITGDTQIIPITVQQYDAAQSAGSITIPIINGKKIKYTGGSPTGSYARPSYSPSTNSGRGGGGKGGGGGKKPTTIKPQKLSEAKDSIKDRSDIYHDINLALDKQEDILDDIQKEQKKLVNRDRLKNLQKQNQQLAKQKSLLDQKTGIAASELVRLRNELFSDLGEAIKFDPNGQIANYNEALDQARDNYNDAIANYNNKIWAAQEAYNDYINKYNLMSGQTQEANKLELERQKLIMDQAKKSAQKSLDLEKEKYDAIKNNVKEYDNTLKLQRDIANQQQEIQDKIYDNLIAISKIKVDLSIDTGDFERDWLDFENKFIKKLDKDDFLGSAKASAKELMSYFNSNQVQQTANQIRKIRDEIAIMNAGGSSDIYGTNLAQAKEDLEDYMKQQMKDLQEVQDMVDNIKDNYLDAIDDAKDKMDEQIDQYERVNDLIDHNVKMVELLYGDKAYDSMQKYYNLQKSNNERELESLKKQQDYWQKKMNNQVVGSDAWERFKKNLDDVTDNLNDKLEDMIDNLASQFENRVSGIIDRLNNALTGGRGLDFLDEQWDYISNYDDNFLDTFETKTGIEEVERLYQSQIDNLVGSPKSQQKLNKLMNDQLKLLREKDHLTEYDLERAKASLEVEKARLALEEARDRKTKMRLRRDSQGNYTYQYVADEQKLGDLQAALADAQANLYNTDKQHYKQNLNTLYDTYKDYIEKMRDLTAEYNATQDEEERKKIQGRIDLLKESTAKLMSGLTEDNKYLLNYLNGSFFDGMGTDTSTLTMEEQMEIMKENIPYMQSQIQDLSDTIVGEGGILPATANMMEQINKATADYDQNVKNMLTAAGTSLQTIEEAVDKEGNALDKNIINAEKLITTNDELIKSCQAQIEAMEKLLDYMDKYLNKVMNVQTLLSNLRSAYNTGQGLNGSNLTADNIGMETWGLDTTSGMEYTGNPKTDAAAIKQQIDALMAQYQKFLSAMTIATFDTGGYTGTWGDAEGRLAFLHSGELVLNQDDTMNILNAVQIVRSMASAINSIASGEINSLMNGASGLLGGINNTEQLDQNVHIEANFPNVTQHTEIEQAFENLVNMASMRASKYRD